MTTRLIADHTEAVGINPTDGYLFLCSGYSCWQKRDKAKADLAQTEKLEYKAEPAGEASGRRTEQIEKRRFPGQDGVGKKFYCRPVAPVLIEGSPFARAEPAPFTEVPCGTISRAYRHAALETRSRTVLYPLALVRSAGALVPRK